MSADVITWGTFLAAATSVGFWVKFWMDRGKAEAAATSAAAMATAAHGKAEMLSADLTAFKVEVARGYASIQSLDAAEKQITMAMDGIRGEIRGMNERLDKFLHAIIEDRRK